LHFLSLLDFQEFCRDLGVREVSRACFNTRGAVSFLPNLRAEEVVSRLQTGTLQPPSSKPYDAQI
jgi:hypothetical protein